MKWKEEEGEENGEVSMGRWREGDEEGEGKERWRKGGKWREGEEVGEVKRETDRDKKKAEKEQNRTKGREEKEV